MDEKTYECSRCKLEFLTVFTDVNKPRCPQCECLRWVAETKEDDAD